MLVDRKENSTAQNDGASANTKSTQQEARIARIELLLRTRDDTSRFVALALLKAVLDDQAKDEEDDEGGEKKSKLKSSLPEETLLRLWEALPVKFLDKLLRAGLKSSSSSSTTAAPKSSDAAHMRDLAVAVLHTFTVHILPVERHSDARLLGRIPLLIASLLNAPDANTSPLSPSPPTNSTTTLILQTLATLVSSETGAMAFNVDVTDLSPLTELAPEQPLVMNILLNAWLHGLLADRAITPIVTATINKTLSKLAAAFKGTDGVTLLDFIAKLLRNAESFAESRHNPDLLPKADPAWMRPVASFVRRLAAKRPTAVARAAYTHAAAALLRVYPVESFELLWIENSVAKNETPFAYLLVSMLLVDLRTTLPGLLAQLNDSTYVTIAARLASAFDILSAFIGYLVRALEDDNVKLPLAPDNLLRLRKSIAETLSVTAEHLRDRWDAAVAGAYGLHPNARSPTAKDYWGFSSTLDAAGLPIAWDTATDELVVERDPLVLAAVRALALWLREDDNEPLRREAAGLADMLLGLYVTSKEKGNLDFRRPVLVALEGISTVDGSNVGDGENDYAYELSTAALLLEQGAWKILSKDLVEIMYGTCSAPNLAADAARGIEIVRVLLPIVENERPGAREEWMDILTLVAAWPGPDDKDKVCAEVTGILAEFRVAVLQLVTALVANAHPSICRRYTHSISAVVGLARRLRPTLAAAHIGAVLSDSLVDALLDVQMALESKRA